MRDFDKERKQHIMDYLRCLMRMNSTTARDKAGYVHLDDYGDCWQARTIHEAITAVAAANINAGHPTQRLLTADINARLVSSGAMTNTALARFWHELVSPTNPEDNPQPEPWRSRELAARITEDHFRFVYHEAHTLTEDMAFTAPIEELTEKLRLDRERFLAIHNRMVTTAPGRTLSFPSTSEVPRMVSTTRGRAPYAVGGDAA
ncbi:hypothetical protein OS128_04445 [Corynebacterium sp. P5848]|uniref:hypothetical protein n=1 Tax=Corynebacterium marambiense TaxID=2765364 RepID=UPI002260F515|nr:hypothetical protein [Corynebacterium marambiense]MCX7542167.1 hypothetical protein [Corynebacterium marambiense]